MAEQMVPNSVEYLPAAHQESVRVLFDDHLPALERIGVVTSALNVNFCRLAIRSLNLNSPVDSLNPNALSRLKLEALSNFVDAPGLRSCIACAVDDAAESGAHATMRTPKPKHRGAN